MLNSRYSQIQKIFSKWNALPDRQKKEAANIFEEKMVKIFNRKNKIFFNFAYEIFQLGEAKK